MGQLNLHDTRTMMQAVEKMMPVNTFFRDIFFSRVETYVTEQIDVDFKKGKRKMAPFVAPRIGGITMDRQGYATKNYTPPRIAPQRATSKDDIAKRMAGEAVYSKTTPEQRAAQLLGKDLAELDELITRREEWMCREVILNGKVTMKGFVDDTGSDVIEQEVDYGFTNKEALVGGALWNQGTATIYDDLKRFRMEIIKGSGRNPNVAILGADAAKELIEDEKIQKLLDVRGYNMGTFEPQIQANGVTFIGKLTQLGLELYTYDEWFIDDDSVEKPMMPVDHVIVGRTDMAKRLYGAITQLEENDFVTYEGERIPRQWVDQNNEVKMLKVSSRPLPVPEDVEDWYVAKVL